MFLFFLLLLLLVYNKKILPSSPLFLSLSLFLFSFITKGIVDRNRLTNATIDRAKELSIAHAKLPISDFFKMRSTSVLTTNHVFEIIARYNESKDWKKAFLDTLPDRKAKEDLVEDEIEENKNKRAKVEKEKVSS